jgi:cyanate permease
VLVGWLHDTTGSFLPGLAIWAAFSWVLALGGLLLPETGPKAKLPAAVTFASTERELVSSR